MSLEVSTVTDSIVEVRTSSVFPCGVVSIGDYDITLQDFLEIVVYVLNKTDLETRDPRLAFLEYVKSMQQVDGWNTMVNQSAHSKRLEATARWAAKR